jgi:endonuclease/exonuclease/phosphatase family metal-dependent hydrolase
MVDSPNYIQMLFHPLMDVDEEHVEESAILQRENIKILTYNIFIRPPPVKNNDNDFKDERLEEFIKGQLKNFDLICLQEMFGSLSSRRDKLVKSAYQSGLFYHVEVPSPSFFSKNMIDAGLVILSRFPIVESEFRPFKYTVLACSLVEKGILYAKIHIKDSYLIVFNLHLQASYFNSNDDIYDVCVKTRLSHIEEAAEYINEILDYTDITDENTVLLMGDFNVDAHNLIKRKEILGRDVPCFDEYKILMQKFNEKFVTYDLWLKRFDKHPYTYGITGEISGKQYDRVLTDRSDQGNSQTLDYIFEIRRNKSIESVQTESEEKLNPNEKLNIDYNSMKVEEFLIENKPFQQLSDHFGASVEIIHKRKNSSPVD